MILAASYRFTILVLIAFGLFTQGVLASSQAPTLKKMGDTQHVVSMEASKCGDHASENPVHDHLGCFNCIAFTAVTLEPYAEMGASMRSPDQIPTYKIGWYGNAVLDDILRPPKSSFT